MWITLALSMAVSPPALAEWAPGTRYAPAIPTLEAVTGHEFGEEITPSRDIELYLKALASAAPDRTRLTRYAESWEGRPLYVLAVASPERMARIDDVKQGLQRLADPRGLSEAEAGRMVEDLPVVTWLLHGVHGNETSSSEAALALAYHLLAAQDDLQVDAILRESVVLIDPTQNPDGRARFIGQNLLGRAALPDPAPFSVEHDEPWPNGRTNHYLFEMNRDWFALTQPETRGRIRVALEWFPHVAVDLHEMRGESTYYFGPPADPINPYVTAGQRRWFEVFGRDNARRFDERGFAYFVREVYDSFYPGYGESWPVLNGAIGATFEQASPRGLAYRRIGDGRLLTYRQASIHHFTAALTTAATAAEHRAALLRDFLDYRRGAVAEGREGPVRAYLFAPGADASLTARLARMLADQGIEVLRTRQPLAAGSRQLPAGTYVVPLAQPASRLVRVLFDSDVPMDDAFVAEQERRRSKRQPDEIYDLTGWSVPLLFDVPVVALERDVPVPTTPLGSEEKGGRTDLPAARVGYLMPWGTGTASAVAEALRTGLLVRQAGKPLTLRGRTFPEGTAFLRAAENPADLADTLGAIAKRHGAEVIPADDSWVEGGISLGSNQMRPLKATRVLLLWGPPTRVLSAGWARYVLERRYGQPVTAVRVGSFGRVPLEKYDVLVAPDGNYSDTLNKAAVARLKTWMEAGGTLITIGEASRWAARKSVGLLETHTQLRDGSPEKEPEADDDKKKQPPKPSSDKDSPYRLEDAIQPKDERPDRVPGALLRVQLDREHWLSSGTDGEVQAVVDSRRVFAPITLDKGSNVGVFAARETLVASGLVWKENKNLLARKPFLIHQPVARGHLVAFAEDPNYRAFAEATQLLFFNAVLLSPAY